MDDALTAPEKAVGVAIAGQVAEEGGGSVQTALPGPQSHAGAHVLRVLLGLVDQL